MLYKLIRNSSIEKNLKLLEINVAAGLDKFPVHNDRTEGLHMLTFKQSWQTTRGLVTKDVYDCPLRKRCLCKCQFLVCSSVVQTQLFVRSQHNAASHANDTSKGFSFLQRKALEQAVRVVPLLLAKALARNRSNLIITTSRNQRGAQHCDNGLFDTVDDAQSRTCLQQL